MTNDERFVDFVFDENSESITYFTHRTEDNEIADKILQEGLLFSESFQKTTDLLLNDNVHIRYWRNLRKEYGSFTIVIGYSSQLMLNYQKLLKNLTKKNYEVQQILTNTDPIHFEESDEVYKVPLQFIKGYMNGKTGNIVMNPNFDPYFDSPVFKRNIDNLLEKEKSFKKGG